VAETRRRHHWVRIDAVAYATGLTVQQIRAQVARGKLPRPSYHLGYLSPVWDRDVLTAMLRPRAARRLPPPHRDEPAEDEAA